MLTKKQNKKNKKKKKKNTAVVYALVHFYWNSILG